MAPPELVLSATNGTLLAPLATVVVAALFILCACYGLSAANILQRLPLLSLGIYSIAAVCLVRGVATLPLSFLFPDMVSVFSIFAGMLWLLVGLLFLFGYRYVQSSR